MHSASANPTTPTVHPTEDPATGPNDPDAAAAGPAVASPWDPATALAAAGQLVEAATLLERLADADSDAYAAAQASLYYTDAREYDRALAAAERSVALAATSVGYEALALALWRDLRPYDLAEDVRTRFYDAFDRAVDLPYCSLSCFSDWERLLGHRRSRERQVEVYARAVTAYPDVARFRLALAYHLPHERAPEFTRLELLLPLVAALPAQRDDRVELARLLLEAGEPARALEVAGALGPLPDDTPAPSVVSDTLAVLVFRGRCQAALGQHEQAAAEFAKSAALDGGGTARVAARFCEAAAHLAGGRVGAAILAVGHGLDAWYAGGCPVGLYLPGTLNEDDDGFPAEPPEIATVCEHFCRGAGAGRINGLHLGRLSWMLLVDRYGDGGGPWAEGDVAILEQARRLAPSPLHTRRLVTYLMTLGRHGEALRVALDLTLDGALARALRPRSADEDAEEEAELDGEARTVPTWGLPASAEMSPELRVAIHRLSLDALRAAPLRAEAAVSRRAQSAPYEERAGFPRAAREAVRAVFAGWYAGRWRDVLWAGKHWPELAEAAEAVATLDEARQDQLAWFDLGYARSELGDPAAAEAAYREDLRVRDYHGTHNNLALLLEAAGRLEEAAVHVRRAMALDSARDRSKWLARLEQRIRASQEDDEFRRTAPGRWPQVEGQGRSVLAALCQVTSFSGFRHLGRLSGMTEEWAERHYKKLVRLGMVIETTDGGWQVNPHVLPLLERERSHAVATQVIRADETILYKPIFDSRAEYTVYQILTTLFPNQLVFPNMALSAVFQFDRMKEVLDGDMFGYFLRARVDFCITHTGTYYPIIAFELDSRWHDTPEQQAKDEWKNRIFQLGGVPLLRLRPLGSPTPERIRHDIVMAVASCGQLLATNEKLAARLGELDLDRFLALARAGDAGTAAGDTDRSRGARLAVSPARMPVAGMGQAASRHLTAEVAAGATLDDDLPYLEDEDDDLPF